MYIENIVIGNPVYSVNELLSFNNKDWEIEKEKTYFTNERYLPRILVDIGVVKSANEVRKNKPQMNITLDKLDFMEIKWGKKKLWIVVGE